uniref:Uncharacterized protein n=1 Tax=Lactuca sativa TaxID=4236 RepID=A0A9R1VP64_LACSA|nr:hypothetical protein LSAT_V11C500267180 [Lactuca sativa]
MNPDIRKIVTEVNDNSSSSKDELINNNLLLVLSCTAQLLVQNNASSSKIHRRNTIHRDRLEAERLLIRQYFADDTTYGHTQFHRRFCMSKGLFMRLVGDLEMNYPYFQTTWDATNQRSLLTSGETLENLCYGVVHMYKGEYLRCTTSTNIQLLYEAHEARQGFPGMLALQGKRPLPATKVAGKSPKSRR